MPQHIRVDDIVFIVLCVVVVHIATSAKCKSFVIVIPSDEQYICNMFSQDSYGYDGQQYTSIDAIRKCFEAIKRLTYTKNNLYGAKIAMPYKIGCVRGGADWNVVLPMILETLTNIKEIQFYKL